MQDLLRWFFVLGIRRFCTSFVSVSMHHEDHVLHLLRMLLHWCSWMKEWSTQAEVFCGCGFESISCQPCTVQFDAICSSSCLLIRSCCNPIFSYITYWCWRASRKNQRGWGFKCRLSQLSFPGKMIGDYGRKRLFKEVQDLLDKLHSNLSKPSYLWYEHFCMGEAVKSYWSM